MEPNIRFGMEFWEVLQFLNPATRKSQNTATDGHKKIRTLLLPLEKLR